MDGTLACLGFVLTFLAFLSLTAWDFAWWAVKLRTPRFSYEFHVLVLAGAFVWIAFGVAA